MAELTACPLCRAALSPGAATCPDCGGDLAPYHAIQQRASEYIELARELISRGELEQAQVICDGLPLLADDVQAEVNALKARLLLARDELADAGDLLAKLPAGAEAAQLHSLLAQRREARLAGRELYNSALALARTGSLALAAQQLSQAVVLQPREPAIRLLKLKIDLKARNFEQCYAGLSALDRLSARPPEFTHLEQLLPPISR